MKLNLFFIGVLFSLSSLAQQTRYLVVGGGYKPASSQIVLELNMELAHSLIEKKSPDAFSHYFYGSGNDQSALDVIEEVQMDETDELFLSLLFPEKCVNCDLRHNHLNFLDGAATQSILQEELWDVVENQEKFDNFRFYYTGHGSGDSANEPDTDYQNNRMSLWNKEGKLTVKEFTNQLNKLEPRKSVQVVMVQCFSGGFAQMIYKGGSIKSSLTEADQCGFFSQLPNRLAAGCSPDLKEREEYSPYFFAAIKGKDENGKPVDADFNSDGTVGSDEAHAYVIMKENSIDIPIKTSDFLLRRLSKEKRLGVGALDYSAGEILKLIDDDATRKKLFVSLVKELGLAKYLMENKDIKYFLSYVSELKNKLEKEYNDAVDFSSSASQVKNNYISRIHNDLMAEYQIFHNPRDIFSEGFQESQKNFKEQKSEMVDHQDYEQYKAASFLYKGSYDLYKVAQNRYTKVKRLRYFLKTLLLEKNLRESGDSLAKEKEKYESLRSCESRPFFL